MMHSFGDAGANSVPAFLTKLWALVGDPETDDLICWDSSGHSFHVYDQARFSKEVLPLYFKHNNIASFIRQLNMYGFRKLTNLDQGSLKVERDDLEFHHPFFQKYEEQLLERIHRKISKVESVKLTQTDVSKVLNEVKVMQNKQNSMTHKMDSMKRENEALWREVATLRQKHIKQQQIVNKLIHFLASLVGRSRPGLKRKLPLMLNDASQIVPQKMTKFNRQLSIEERLEQSTSKNFDVLGGSQSGLIIHEVTDTANEGSANNDVFSPLVESPNSQSETTTASHTATNTNGDSLRVKDFLFGSDAINKPLVPDSDPGIPASLQSQSLLLFPEITDEEEKPADSMLVSSAVNRRNDWTSSDRSSVSEVNEHVDLMQSDLDSLKDFFQNGIETSTLSGLFDESGRLDINAPPSSSGSITGNELIHYTSPEELPSLFDLAEDDDNLLGSINFGEDLGTLNTPLIPEDRQLKSIKDKQVKTEELD
ncbi:hypothetical protein ScPMuIL_001440 [Solemya velum]